MKIQRSYRVRIVSPKGTHTLIVRASDESRAGLAALVHMDQRNPHRYPLVLASVDFK